MDNTPPPVRLLGLCGSLRGQAYSRAILHGLKNALPPYVVLEIRDLALPLYNEDHDGPNTPAEIAAFRKTIAASDGLILSTPEYNHGIPGVLKNALDWASRPVGRSCLAGKPFLAITSSPAFTGGVRAQAQLNETMLSACAVPVPSPQVVIGQIGEKVRDGALVDDAAINFALSAVDRLITLCRRCGPAVAA